MDDEGKANITASSVMSYHNVLHGSEDYYEALRYARIIADNLTKTLDVEGVEVFPYSVFYVFFEQYLTIWSEALKAIGYSLLVVALGSFLFSGLNLFSTFIITLMVFLTVIHMACLMFIWNITLNAVSLVNLAMVIIIYNQGTSLKTVSILVNGHSSGVLWSHSALLREVNFEYCSWSCYGSAGGNGKLGVVWNYSDEILWDNRPGVREFADFQDLLLQDVSGDRGDWGSDGVSAAAGTFEFRWGVKISELGEE